MHERSGVIKDQIRDAVNIVDLIGQYLTLKKRGRNFIGLCPFHQEKTPSFNVNPEKQIFHCFGCGKGGDVYAFLMDYEKVTFPEALRMLSEQTGIALPEKNRSSSDRSAAEQMDIANRTAAQFFRNALGNAPASVHDYIRGRGLSAETVASFELGYAPDGWDNLKKHIEKGGYRLDSFKTLGLLITNEEKRSVYDRFRKRLMFPIHNTSGKVIAFGGRILEKDSKSPKYINSPESPVYQKSEVLYGLYQARESIREAGNVLMVEGYMDVIQLAQHGIGNVVATSGTALTEQHARQIKRYAGSVCLCYDADKAGVNAALRGGEVLFREMLEVNVLILPEGEDPDSYVNQYGPEAFRGLVNASPSFFDFLLDQVTRRHDLSSATGRSAAVNQALQTLVLLKDTVQSGYYMEKTADRFRIPLDTVRAELQKLRSKQSRRQNAMEPPLPAEPDAAPKRQQGPLMFTGAWGGEKDIILLLINFYNDIHEYVKAHVSEADFLNTEFKDIFMFIRDRGDTAGENLLHAVLEYLQNDAMKSLILRELEHTNAEFRKPALYLQGCIKQIKIARYKSAIEISRRRLKELAPADSNYLPTLQEMQQAMHELKKWQDVVCSDA